MPLDGFTLPASNKLGYGMEQFLLLGQQSILCEDACQKHLL
jgi:hypothetical protein